MNPLWDPGVGADCARPVGQVRIAEHLVSVLAGLRHSSRLRSRAGLLGSSHRVPGEETHEGSQGRTAAGVLGIGPAAQRRGAGRRGRAPGLRLDLDRRGLRLGRIDTARLVGLADRAGPPRHRPVPTVGPDADGHGHGRHHHGSPVGWSFRPRARRLRTAGRRGLVRPVVREAVGPHPRVPRHRAPGGGPRGRRQQRRPPLPAPLPGRHRARQAPQVHHSSPPQGDPDHHGRRGTEEHRSRRRNSRRMVPDLLLPRSGRRLPALPRRGLRP
jgi:hypothetical protein